MLLVEGTQVAPAPDFMSRRVVQPSRGVPSFPLVVPVVTERRAVGTRTVERARKVVRRRTEVVDQSLLAEHVVIRRVPINRFVDGPVPIRYDGEVAIIPIVEEVPVIEKRLRLKEEVHVGKRHVTVRRSNAGGAFVHGRNATTTSRAAEGGEGRNRR